MAITKLTYIDRWDTFHYNGPFPAKMILELKRDPGLSGVQNLNDTVLEIRRQLQICIAENQRFRAFGSGWSLSRVAQQNDRLLATRDLTNILSIVKSDLQARSQYNPDNLFLFQCGLTVKEITRYLSRKGKSLKTCGASNGQTIAGAISTGVHGAAFDEGSIQDAVVGLQLILGPDPQDVVYLERKSKPALSKKFAVGINSRLIRHDGLFNAALVSLGSFGIINAVVMEAENSYLLQRYVKYIKRKDALELATTLDFDNAVFKIDDEVLPHGKRARPYHYKLYINPFNDQEDFVTEIIYKKPYHSPYDNPIPVIHNSIFKDVPTWVANFAAKHNWLIPKILSVLKTQAFPKIDEKVLGTLGEIFWDTSQSSKAFGCGLGINISDCTKALDLYIKMINTLGPIPGILSMRFVKGSQATLAFTKFPVTCILEIDGVPWTGNPHMISLDDFLTGVIKAFVAAAIPFTLHWGKNGPWDFPGLIDIMYGDADDEWKNMRSCLLTKQMADLFSNDFLSIIKLDDYRVSLPSDLAALRKIIHAPQA